MNRHSDKDTYSQAGDWLMGAARRNPEALLLLAAGCALFMRGKGTPRQEPRRAGHHEDSWRSPLANDERTANREGLGRTTQKTAEYAADIKDRVSETVSDYAATVSDFAGEASRTVSEQSGRLARQAQSTMQDTVDSLLRNQPLAIAAAGLAAGALVAAAFPSTEMEDRALGGAHEALTDAADKAKQTVVGAATKAGERLMAAAEERGLTSQGLKDVAGEVADTFTQAVAGKDGEDERTSMVPDSPATAQYGISEMDSEKRDQADRQAKARPPVGAGSGAKR